MKLPILLGALLNSVSHAIADDFVNFECDYELKIESIAIRTNILAMCDVEKSFQFSKVDLKYNALMTRDPGKWRDVLIVNSILYEGKYDESDKHPIEGNLSIVIQPPGIYSGEFFLRMTSLGLACVSVDHAKEVMLQYSRSFKAIKQFINDWIGLSFCIGMVILTKWIDKQDWIDFDPVLNEMNNQVEVKQ